MYLADRLDRLVILDEIHRAPRLFPALRGLIDRARRAGRRYGLYPLLGSASLEMLKQSGETLAARVSYLGLNPFDILEVTQSANDAVADRLWLRGGFPASFLAKDEAQSLRWRQDFIRTYLERDLPQFGRRIPAGTLRQFWIMLAHHWRYWSMSPSHLSTRYPSHPIATRFQATVICVDSGTMTTGDVVKLIGSAVGE